MITKSPKTFWLALLVAIAAAGAACSENAVPVSPSTSHADAANIGGPHLERVALALATDCTVTSSQPDGSYTAVCSNGCFVKWSPEMDAPYVTCKSSAKAPWVAPCANPRHKGDGDPKGGTCWAPPVSWCADLAGAAEVVACSATGQCCRFPDDCLPCGWQACTPMRQGSVPSGVCAKANVASCPADLVPSMKNCSLCGDVLVCP